MILLASVHADPVACFLVFASVWCCRLPSEYSWSVLPWVDACSLLALPCAVLFEHVREGVSLGVRLLGWGAQDLQVHQIFPTFPSPLHPTSDRRGSRSSSLGSAECGELGPPWDARGVSSPCGSHCSAHDPCGWRVVSVSPCTARLCNFCNFPFLWFFRCFLGAVYIFWIIVLHQLDVLLVPQLCPALCHPMDCSPPGFSVHRIFQARVLDWVPLPSSRGSSWRDWTQVSCITGRFLTVWATWEIRCTVDSI